MTSTHLEPDNTQPAASLAAPADPSVDPVAPSSPADSLSADSSFSDAYKEQPSEEKGVEGVIAQVTEVSDDYAMTFDSDGEDQADSQGIAQENIQQQTQHLPVTVLSNNMSSIETTTNNVPQSGQNAEPTRATPPSPHPTSIDAAANLPNTSTSQAPTTTPQTQSYEAPADGEIDTIQLLLDNIVANGEKNAAAKAVTQSPALTPTTSSLPTHSSLPPRPQVPPNSTYDDDIQKYHTGPPGVPPQAANSYRHPPTAPPGANFVMQDSLRYSADPRGLLPPPPAAFNQQHPPSASPISPSSYNPLNGPPGQGSLGAVGARDDANDLDAKWGPDIQKLYDTFLAEERMYVTEGLWDRFPIGSRLFIGNLPSEKLTKRDLFHVFHKYGKLAQISIKQAYGFIQFHEAAACHAALQNEQNVEVRERKLHLEISKPQKNSRNAQANAPPVRNRTPEYNRGGGQTDRGGRQQGGRMPPGDRYDGRSNVRNDEYGRPLRIRDDYRPVRSPTPPRAFRGRDEYMPRGRDQYDGRDRRRSRSRSPYSSTRDNARYRERSPSPRSRQATEDESLPIPRRSPQNIPDVQIILMDQLDKGFVDWVESEFHRRSLKTDVIFLSPRLPLQAVIRRQILEGVHAVSQVTMRSQSSSKIPLQVFDRQGGIDNVRFDEYQDLEPRIAAELVLRAKQTPVQPQVSQVPQYTQPQYQVPQAYQPPAPAPAPAPISAPVQAAPNLANLVGQLDNASLQKLLGTLSAPQQQNPPVVAANPVIDLAGLLGGLQPQQPQQNGYTQNNGYTQPLPADPYAGLANNPALASLLGGHAIPPAPQTQPQQQSAQQVQNIMAQLAKFRQ
ncbi:hypothetical protein BGZ60DRAFT_471435 [Tricladium varicosporioides]|nr:hypothetical protein BGZ60DRAFT_471435 [Hymenoscyphus varicosporioides]